MLIAINHSNNVTSGELYAIFICHWSSCMKLTNKYGYPQALERAIMADPYNRGDSEFSATSLLKPARISALEALHKDELTADIDERMFILYGQIVHVILERSGLALGKAVVEKRFFGTIDDVKISAQIDTLSLDADGTLTDFKFTSVFGFKPYAPIKEEYVQQLNIQLELLRQNGLDAKKLQICGLLRDWRPGEAKKGNYPNKVATINIPIWPRDKTIKYISGRIKEHRAAVNVLPDCSATDHWGWKRCQDYCQVAKFCTQYQNYKKQKGELKL